MGRPKKNKDKPKPKQPATYYHVKYSKKRIVVNQGGTRSGKTYSTLQSLIELCYFNKNQGLIISIVRKTLPSLKQTAMRDFFEILHAVGWYQERHHNKTENTYNLFGNLVEFFAVDKADKVRGSKRHILFINEAPELSWDEFFQLNIRTIYKVIIDYNPSMAQSWIYDKVHTRADAEVHITTYKDNPYLRPIEVREIESLKETDAFYWTVFGLGLRGVNPAVIFQYKTTPVIPERARFMGYGLDWGYSNDPSALVGLYKDGLDLYIDELLYQQYMTNDDIHEFMIGEEIQRYEYIIADSSEPKSVEDLRRKGWKIRAAKKGRDSIGHGIDVLKRHKMFVTSRSVNVIREMDLYKWKQYPDGMLSNVPVDKYNHALDALRYIAEYSLEGRGVYLIS